MKKSVLIKGILVLIIIALLTLGFTGCGVVISTTGTVYITVSVPGYYDIWVDGYYQATTNGNGQLTLTGVPMGSHFFEADGYDYGYWSYYYYYWYEGTRSQTIYSSISNVTIPVILHYI